PTAEAAVATLREITANCLGMNPSHLDADAPFVDLGVDSILGVELVRRINDQLALSLPPTVLFDYPNLTALTAFIGKQAPVVVQTPEPVAEDIAIIGIAGRFPDAENVDAFWRNLAAGHCSFRDVPPGRWTESDLPEHRRGAFLDDIDLFDPLFFNMSGAEAEMSDPQQRLFLEECWNALDDAGYARGGDRCGVYVGVAKGDYQVRLFADGIAEPPSFWGNEGSVLASRISYFLDLRGPSVAVNTACSSSLVAVHLACQALRSGDCTIALAGGVYVGTTPNLHRLAGNAGMLSPDGVCRAFDQDANGFVPGEAVGAIVLKPLASALRDGDRIRAVIKGTGINQDGRTNGITAPSARAQTDLEVEVLERANVRAETIGYVEAHGTGTKLGDPIEVRALVDAFRRHTDRRAFCALGSVKTNIGHAITAAGISGLIKAVLALEHAQIPPSLHFRAANEHLPLDGSPFFVNTELRAWERSADAPRRAAVSSFGFSGTNAHVILEEAPVVAPVATKKLDSYFFAFSARGERELRRVLDGFARWLKTSDEDLADVAYTLLVGRMHFRVRAGFVASDREELLAKLASSVDASSSYDDATLAQWRATLTGRRRVSLPPYPFERKRYWHGPRAAEPAPAHVDVRRVVAEVLKVDVEEIASDVPLAEYGMDSLAALRIAQKLEIAPESMFTCATVEELSAALAPRTRPVERSLAQLVEAKEIAPIDAAAILTVPLSVLANGVTRESIRTLFDDQPYWFNLLSTQYGRLGLFFMPMFDDEVYLDEARTVRAVLETCEAAGRVGARTVALTGLIPSATSYAESIPRDDARLPKITTGHAVTASAVVLAVERLLAESGRALEQERVGFLGAGSIGSTVLMLMARVLPHPREIVLCDVYGAEKRLEQLRQTLIADAGYRGEVRIAASRKGVAEEIYSATLIVGATNVPNLLDIARVNPGTLIVDDSAPHCFRTADARARLEQQGDILFTEGGLLRLPQSVEQMYSVTREMLTAMPAERMDALNWVGHDDPNEIMGCMFSALLSTFAPDLAPTIGRIDWPNAERHYHRLRTLGITSAALHCEDYHLPPEAIRGFGEKFGRK
ncbi:MAG TPA: beta-ketoacyl synthase N-terminal-like domain-containing protein, partial [Thermoanaerobaculia bacterium]|nr:beta-ketoacyl synthase N-terminal-like domain-containing protein [Thermoanaerobaculia bacterium]